MKLRFLPNSCAVGVVVDTTDNTTEKYLPHRQVLDKVRALDDASGQKASIVSVYNESGAEMTVPVALCRALLSEGRTPCVLLWQADDDGDGVCNAEHGLEALASGASDGILRKIDQQAREVGPIIIGIDEPSGWLWGHPSQGGPNVASDRFKVFWRRMRFIVTAPNVTWFLRFGTGWGDDASNTWKRAAQWWPGAEHVDVLGLNTCSFGRFTDGTVVWPKETSAGDVWTAADALDDVWRELATLPGAETLPLSVGFWCAQDPEDSVSGQQAERTRLSRLLTLMEQSGKIAWADLWADDSYVRGVDPLKFPAVCKIVKSRFGAVKYTPRVGIA